MCYSLSHYEDEGEYLWPFVDEEEDEGVLLAFFDSMHGDTGKSPAMGACIPQCFTLNPPLPVTRQVTHEVSRKEKRKHQMLGTVELGYHFLDHSQRNSQARKGDRDRVEKRTCLHQEADVDGGKSWSSGEILAMVEPRSHDGMGFAYLELQMVVEPCSHGGQGTSLGALPLVVELRFHGGGGLLMPRSRETARGLDGCTSLREALRTHLDDARSDAGNCRGLEWRTRIQAQLTGPVSAAPEVLTTQLMGGRPTRDEVKREAHAGGDDREREVL